MLRDIERQLTNIYKAQQPECVNIILNGGRWYVWVNYHGWVSASNLLKGSFTSDRVGKYVITPSPLPPRPKWSELL